MNKFTRPIDSTLLKNKIEKLSATLKRSLADQDVSTLEQMLAEATQVVSSFYRDLGQPKFVPSTVLPGEVPSVANYNRNLQNILDDLEIVFAELENVESLVLQNFNYFVSESNRLNRKVKTVSSKLGDYVLFASNILKDTLFFSDSFNNLNNIETDTSFLTNPQAEINQAEGIITLPITRSPDSVVKITTTPVINSNSNGVAGNNQEIGADRNDQIDSILDGNPDTWFEYERVIAPAEDDGTPLTLDMRLDLGSEKVINFIRINPNNFGTRTQIDIDDISTSTDGTSFTSVKDEIPVPGFTTIDEPNVFTLAPSTSKYAGQGLYSFTPRLARYVHLVLRQKTPYVINTLIGQRLRYAIGLRDVEVSALRYSPVGEVVSREFSITGDEIRKILLLSSQSPSEESELVSISHFVSPNNGDTWYEIRPKDFTGLSDTVNQVPEVLDFNSNSETSIQTNAPVRNIRYRALLRRNAEAFQEGASSLRQNTKFKTELHQVPNTSPLVINLDRSPVAGTVQLIDPHFGSRGLDSYRYTIAIGNESVQIHQLPFRNIQMDREKIQSPPLTGPYFVQENSPVRVYVNGERWASANLSTSPANARVYTIDHSRGILKFGDGTNGRTPDQGSIISIDFTPERFLSDKTELGHVGKLAFPSNGDQGSVIVKRFDAVTSHNEPLEKGVKVFRLNHSNIQSGTVLFRPTSGTPFSPSGEKTFIDGKVELTASGHWSLDYETGTLYSYDATSTSSEVTISYKYQPVVQLDQSEWYFSGSGALKDTVVIKDAAWATIPISSESIPSGVKKFSLAKLNIEPGTLKFTESTPTAFKREVEFIDGRTEILGLIKAAEVVPNGVLVGSGVKTFSLSLIPADTSVHVVSFSNRDVFVTQVPGVPVAPGEYRIVGKVVDVYISATVTNPGNVTYFYQDPTKSPAGAYSVDYKLGNVYTYTATLASTTAAYQYSHVEVSYPIARVIPETDIEVDPEAKRLVVNDREVLRRLQIPATPMGQSGASNTYQVLYNYIETSRAGIDQLEPFFTPMLKEYVLKVLPKGKLF